MFDCQSRFCFLEREAYPSWLSTGWFQEQI